MDIDFRKWLHSGAKYLPEPRFEYRRGRLAAPFFSRPTRLGFGYVAGGNRDVRVYIFSVRYWVLLLATSIVPSVLVWLAIRRRYRRHAKSGRCPTCCYDLRATPGRCPECGTAAPAGGAGTSAAAAPGPPAPDDPARRAA